MTDRETLATVSRSHDDYLGHGGTQKEKDRGTLQTSALPLGYGAARRKLASYLDFLKPPWEVLPTSLNLCGAAQRPWLRRSRTVLNASARPPRSARLALWGFLSVDAAGSDPDSRDSARSCRFATSSGSYLLGDRRTGTEEHGAI